MTTIRSEQILDGTIVNVDIAAAAAINWTKVSKAGSSLADLITRSAGDLSSGILLDARLSANVPLLNAANIFTANQRINAGLGVNIAPPAAGALALSGGVFERSRAVAMGEWASYTPTWGALSGSNSLGNGTLTGRTMRIGQTVFFKVSLQWGSTTTGSADAWLFSLPAAANDTTRSSLGLAYALDAGLAAYPGFAITYQGVSSTDIFASVTGGTVLQGVPFTWGVSDLLSMTGYYEIP